MYRIDPVAKETTPIFPTPSAMLKPITRYTAIVGWLPLCPAVLRAPAQKVGLGILLPWPVRLAKPILPIAN